MTEHQCPEGCPLTEWGKPCEHGYRWVKIAGYEISTPSGPVTGGPGVLRIKPL